MKIRPSLKVRFIASMILLASVMAIFFSTLMLDYFFRGMDISLAQTMRGFVNVKDVKKGQPIDFLGYKISNRWEDMPPEVIQSFGHTPPTEIFKLEKYSSDISIITPPEKIVFIMKAINDQGEIRYISKVLFSHEPAFAAKRIPHIIYVIMGAMGAIAVFSLILFLLIGKVASLVESLTGWAKSIDEEKLKQSTPDFQYGELNTLANIIKTSFSSVQKSLAREHQFLTHASHELRTPISVIRTNTELLAKLYEKDSGTTKQFAAIERIDRAGRTMTNLTETLLWLSRDDSNLPQSEQVNLKNMIDELIWELSYLLKSKAVKLTVNTSDYTIYVAAIPCRIVLTNLIRNAFQHTADGKIIVTQIEGTITVVNSSTFKSTENTNLGFGLGLSLTKQLAKRYNWHYFDRFDKTTYTAHITLFTSLV